MKANLTSSQKTAGRGLMACGLFILFVIFFVGFCTVAAQAQEPPVQTSELSPTERSALVDISTRHAIGQRLWAEYYAYLPGDIAFQGGQVEGYEIAAVIIAQSRKPRPALVAELRAYAAFIKLPNDPNYNGKATALESVAYYVERYRPGLNF